MNRFVISALLFHLIEAQNFQPRCRESCANGEFAEFPTSTTFKNDSKSATSLPQKPECENGSIPLLSVEHFKISGSLTCNLKIEEQIKPMIILFNRCDENLYREIGRTNSFLVNGIYYYKLAVSNKITDANLYLSIRHNCELTEFNTTFKDSLVDLRAYTGDVCRKACSKQCDIFRGIEFCDCNVDNRTVIGLNCKAICGGNKNPSGCVPECMYRTYCSVDLDIELKYV